MRKLKYCFSILLLVGCQTSVEKSFHDLNEAFTDDCELKNDMLATPSKKACRFCEFNQTEYCDRGVR